MWAKIHTWNFSKHETYVSIERCVKIVDLWVGTLKVECLAFRQKSIVSISSDRDKIKMAWESTIRFVIDRFRRTHIKAVHRTTTVYVAQLASCKWYRQSSCDISRDFKWTSERNDKPNHLLKDYVLTEWLKSGWSCQSAKLDLEIKPCMSKYKYYKAKLRMAHYNSCNLFDDFLTWITVGN